MGLYLWSLAPLFGLMAAILCQLIFRASGDFAWHMIQKTNPYNSMRRKTRRPGIRIGEYSGKNRGKNKGEISKKSWNF